MKNLKVFLNLGMILFSVALVLFVRTEARKTSFKVHKKYAQLKDVREDYQRMKTHYNKQNSYAHFEETKTHMAVKDNRNQKYVMVQNSLKVVAQ